MRPSLALIPSSYIAGKLHSLIPEDGTGDFTVSRNGGGTRVNKNGLIESAPAHVPRFEFDPITGEFLGVLVEPAATNFIENSLNLNTLSRTGISGVENLGDGWWKISEDTSTGNHRLTITGSINSVANLSIYVRKDSTRDVRLQHVNSGFSPSGYFNPSSGIGSLHNINYETTNYLRIVRQQNATPVGGGIGFISLTQDENASYTGTGGYIIIKLPQIEPGTSPTSPIPTIGSQVTRPADIISKTGIGDIIPQLYSDGYIFIDFIRYNAPSTGTNLISINKLGYLSNGVSVSITSGGDINIIINASSTYDGSQNRAYLLTGIPTALGQRYKVCVTWNNVSAKTFLNGLKINEKTQTILDFLPLNDIVLGTGSMGAQYGSSIRNLSTITKSCFVGKNYFPDSQAIQLTTL